MPKVLPVTRRGTALNNIPNKTQEERYSTFWRVANVVLVLLVSSTLLYLNVQSTKISDSFDGPEYFDGGFVHRGWPRFCVKQRHELLTVPPNVWMDTLRDYWEPTEPPEINVLLAVANLATYASAVGMTLIAVSVLRSRRISLGNLFLATLGCAVLIANVDLAALGRLLRSLFAPLSWFS